MNKSKPICIAKSSKRYGGEPVKRAVSSVDVQGRWPNSLVTYSLTNDTGDIPGDSLETKAINWAFLTWGIRCKNIKFKRVKDGQLADITISFAAPGTDDYFTSESILAYAWYPNVKAPLGGDIVFNDMPKINWSLDGLPVEAWKIDPVHYTKDNPTKFKTINLRQVACHEVGHSLGLAHADMCKTCMMYPWYHNDLLLDTLDAVRIQNIYGKRLIQSSFINSINTLLGRGIIR